MKNFDLKRKKLGFTLAEVLITLGVIGIVAVMTIPTLMIHINTTKFRTQYKKTLSVLNQAVLASQTNYDLNFASINTQCHGATDDPRIYTSICGILNGTLAAATYYPQSEIVTMGGQGLYSPSGVGIPAGTKGYYLFADGSLLGFSTDISGCTLAPGDKIDRLNSRCYGFIDVNGTSAPNKTVQCSDPSLTQISSEIGNCMVRNNSVDMGDIFPIAFHDGTVEPLTNASRFALHQSITNTKN